MLVNEIRGAIQEREKIHSEWDYGIKVACEKEKILICTRELGIKCLDVVFFCTINGGLAIDNSSISHLRIP